MYNVYSQSHNKVTYNNQLKTYFPHLNPNEYVSFLELVQELAKSDPILIASGADDDAKKINLLKQRVGVSRILSKSRLMEIKFNDLTETENIDALRHSIRTRINRFFAAVNMTIGGKKTNATTFIIKRTN